MNEPLELLLAELVCAVTANTTANNRLATAIQNQADAIADLINTTTEEHEDDDLPQGLGGLGSL